MNHNGTCPINNPKNILEYSNKTISNKDGRCSDHLSISKNSSINSKLHRYNKAQHKVTPINMWYLNAQSLRNKFSLRKAHILANNYDIVCITETWMGFVNKEFKAEYEIEDYVLFNQDRIDNRKGGGVIIYVKNNLNPIQIPAINSYYNVLLYD